MVNRPINGWHVEPFETLYQRGVRLFHIDATCSEDIYHPQIRAWAAPERFDYGPQEQFWQRLIHACPDARFCLRLYVASPPWWDEAHPEELQRYADGRVEHEFQRTDRRTLPSLASEIWLRDASDSLRRFLHWLETSGWAEKVWGLLLSYGITWEWGILGSDDFLDYSEPMRRRFRRWLRETYGDARSLRDAWASPDASFETAQIPSPEARLRADGEFRKFPRDRAAFDFQRCLSDANADYLLQLAGTARAWAAERYALGAFYGYTLTAREHSAFTGRYGAGGFQGGHHALQRVLDSGLLDFIGSPYAYVNRDLGCGLLVQHFPLRSVQAHGLHGYDENDLWTFTNPPQFEANISVGYTRTREESIAHQRLALGQALCRGTSYWWTELTEWIGPYASNFSDPDLLWEMQRHREWFEQLQREGHDRSVAQIALVIDEAAVDALGLESKLFLREVYEPLPRWAWCGAPFDVWLASDLTAETMKPYRLAYVFAPLMFDSQRVAGGVVQLRPHGLVVALHGLAHRAGSESTVVRGTDGIRGSDST
jgi:hypothetical protein